jgi:integrase
MRHSDQVVIFIETSINTAKPKNGKRTEYRLRTTRGNVMEHLVLEVLPPAGQGTRPRRVWRVHYDHRLDGQRLRRKIKIGDTSSPLSAIEAKWREIKIAVDGGQDWQAEEEARHKAIEEEKRQAFTFRDLAFAYLEKHSKLNKRTWQDDQRKLNRYILPEIGDLRSEDITKRHIIDLIENVARGKDGTGALVQADRTTALLSSMFNWGRDEDLVQHNPADRIRKRATRKRRTRIFTHDELRGLWNWCDEVSGLSQNLKQARIIIRLAILLGQRRSQISGARRVELVGLGTARPAWHIPHARNKNKDDLHVVPLSPLAEHLFSTALVAAGSSPLLFPSASKQDVPVAPNTISVFLAVARKSIGIEAENGEEAVLHGLRHTFKTEMKRLGIAEDVRKRIQSHRSKSTTSDMDLWYDHADNYDADRAALEAWEKRLQEILKG